MHGGRFSGKSSNLEKMYAYPAGKTKYCRLAEGSAVFRRTSLDDRAASTGSRRALAGRAALAEEDGAVQLPPAAAALKQNGVSLNSIQ